MSKSKKDPLKSLGDLGRGVASNIEAGLQDSAGGIKDIFSGNFNNIGQNALNSLAGGSMSRKEREQRFGETSTTRRKRETAEKAAADVVKDAQNQENAQGQLIANTILGLTESRKRTPGRRQVMSPNLLSQIQGNSLLSGNQR